MYFVVITCCIFAIVSQTDAVYELLPFVTTCKRTDPELSKCWRSSVESLRPYLEKGITEFNIPSIDHWPIRAKFGLSGETFYEEIQHTTFTGGKNFEILDNTISLQDNVITLKLRFPKLHFVVLSKINGTIFNFHFGGNGNSNGTIDELIFDFKLRGHRTVQQSEEEFILFDDTKVNVQFAKYTLTGISFLSKDENEKFIAESIKNHDSFETVIKEFVTETIGQAIIEVLKYVYRNYNLNVLHPL